MASTFSPLLRIELIGTGDQSGTWGNTTNVNLGTLIEQSIAGTATVDVTGGNVTLTNYNGATDQARCMVIRVTGLPGTSRNIVAPASSKTYVVSNGSDSAVVFKTSTSTGITILANEVLYIVYDTVLNDFALVGKPFASLSIANTLVLRDGSGNFTANIMYGELNGTISSNTTATTQTAGDNSTKVATTAYVATAVTNATGSLGTMSTQNSNNVSITGGAISGVTLSTTGTTNTVNGIVVNQNAVGARTIQAVSAGVPTGGNSGDIVYQY